MKVFINTHLWKHNDKNVTVNKEHTYFIYFNFKKIYIFEMFLAVPCGLWDFSFPTRDGTYVPCIGSSES